jgi:acetate kinase
METILTINAGSSSLKFQVFATDGSKELRRLIKGQMDGIGTRPRLCAQALYVIPTDEELMIARHSVALLSRRGTQKRVTAA